MSARNYGGNGLRWFMRLTFWEKFADRTSEKPAGLSFIDELLCTPPSSSSSSPPQLFLHFNSVFIIKRIFFNYADELTAWRIADPIGNEDDHGRKMQKNNGEANNQLVIKVSWLKWLIIQLPQSLWQLPSRRQQRPTMVRGRK